jgi:hypothetical protein
MKKIVVLMALTLMFGTAGTAVAFGEMQPPSDNKEYVSQWQYQTLLKQCRYVKTAMGRTKCENRVERKYRIGKESNPNLDCRTYSSITVCGELQLSPEQLMCVSDSVSSGLTRRRSEVECYALG